MISDTEFRLSFWRDGSTKAERLASSLLGLSGYQEIDPQSPLGGPDGKKDIVCQKGGITWIGAVYFPIGPKRFAEIKKKFLSDLEGVREEHGGFVFVTNQSLTPKQRAILLDIVHDANKEADIIHLQRMVNLLDAAPGYGVRIQFLKIPLTLEEQLSWMANTDSQTAKALTANTRELRTVRALVERLGVDQEQVVRTLGLIGASGAVTPDLISVSSFIRNDHFQVISQEISPELVLLFHRLTCFELPSRAVGVLRTKQVWLANSDGQTATHAQPPEPDVIEAQLIELCAGWNESFVGLRSNSAKLSAISEFHAKFLLLHPFLDGNGRVARAILMQQCLDLFSRADMTLMNKGVDYYEALRSADAGNFDRLISLIQPIVGD